jgi:hypothetical protein
MNLLIPLLICDELILVMIPQQVYCLPLSIGNLKPIRLL